MAEEKFDVYRPTVGMPKQEVGNINPFGISQDPALLKEYEASIEAQKKVADVLEQRYAAPNWGRISAAFLKPQLGGFGASFGSAQEELGNYMEAARAAQPTIAQMRADVAKGMFNLAQQNAAARIAEEATQRGFMYPGEAGKAAGFTQGSAGVAKAMTEQETAIINQFATKLKSAGSVVELKNQMGEAYVNSNLPLALAMFPYLRDIIPDIPKTTKPSGAGPAPVVSRPTGVDNTAALAENERKTRALIERTRNQITPADKAELERLNRERSDLGGQPITAPRADVGAQAVVTSQAQEAPG